MKWQPFKYQGISYQLDHLDPFEFVLVQEATNNKPERKYFFDVIFSMHCFTKTVVEKQNREEQVFYSDSRERREICLDRYELSKQLPEIIRSLGRRKCYHTTYGNYFTIEMIGSNGEKENYEIYFTVSKSSKRGRLNLFVQSAYVRSESNNQRKKKKPIGFTIIAHNTFMNKPIKPTQ